MISNPGAVYKIFVVFFIIIRLFPQNDFNFSKRTNYDRLLRHVLENSFRCFNGLGKTPLPKLRRRGRSFPYFEFLITSFLFKVTKVKLLCYGVERCGRISQTLYDLRWRGGSLVLDNGMTKINYVAKRTRNAISVVMKLRHCRWVREKLTLNFSRILLAIRFNLVHSWPSWHLFRSSVTLTFFSVLLN